ncbi:MAG: hypothetical protein CM15mP11_10030 [Gammaproteobacteria bacterium]|nr:MAG: hypothetical protein CM15mP11_10030 [Gammaproteobacteria bacterium]
MSMKISDITDVDKLNLKLTLLTLFLTTSNSAMLCLGISPVSKM